MGPPEVQDGDSTVQKCRGGSEAAGSYMKGHKAQCGVRSLDQTPASQTLPLPHLLG